MFFNCRLEADEEIERREDKGVSDNAAKTNVLLGRADDLEGTFSNVTQF